MRLRRLFVVLLFVFAPALASAQPRVPTPDEHLGRKLGGDFTLADWSEVSSYYKKLAETSDRVTLEKIGTSAEGRDFLMAVISSPANLKNLDAIKQAAHTLADPRGKSDADIAAALRDGKPIVMISLAMHATECAGTQFGMDMVYHLAVSDAEPWKSARDNMVVVVFPSTNPDGLDHVADWYRKTVGTPHEGSALLKLYQLYTGHDNNRDWFMLTQPEARLITKQMYSNWFPHIYWDVHQQGSEKERFFVPPYRDPLNANLDAGLLAVTYAVGQRAVADMTREGFTGVSTGSTYDMWWTGGNRTTPVRHNIISFLTEAASSNIASPMFIKRSDLKDPRGGKEYRVTNQLLKPWPGGWWRLHDIIDYEMAFVRSLLASVNREPEVYMRTVLESARRAIDAGRTEGPRAWIIPSDNRDPSAVRRLIDALMLGGINVHVTDSPIDADGRRYPAGSIVIRADQPYGTHVKDLFDIQRYPEGEPPYDIAGWTLPLLMGVRAVEVVHDFDAKLKPVATADEAAAAFKGLPKSDTGMRTFADTAEWTALAADLKAGKTDDDPRIPKRLPRVGVYAPWTGDIDEGWMRYVLELVKVPYISVRPEMVRAGRLRDDLDVIIFAGATATQINRGRPEGSVPPEFAGGLSPEGNAAVEEFVRAGGHVIAVDNSCAWAIDLFKLPLTDAAEKGFSCPGSVLRTIPVTESRWAYVMGLPDTVPVFFSKSSGFKEAKGDKSSDVKTSVLLRYAPTEMLMSGWVNKPEMLEGTAAWVRASYGKGAIHLFGFRPQYRAWSQAAFHPLLRAIFLDPPRDN